MNRAILQAAQQIRDIDTTELKAEGRRWSQEHAGANYRASRQCFYPQMQFDVAGQALLLSSVIAHHLGPPRVLQYPDELGGL